MRTLYIECNMGAAGDMLLAALYELLEDKSAFLDTMNGLGLPGVHLEAVPGTTCGIAGTHMRVTVHGEEEHEPAAGHRPRPRARAMTMPIRTNMPTPMRTTMPRRGISRRSSTD